MVWGVFEIGVNSREALRSLRAYYQKPPSHRPKKPLKIVRAIPPNPDTQLSHIINNPDLDTQKFLDVCDDPNNFLHRIPHINCLLPRAKIEPHVANGNGYEYLDLEDACGGWFARVIGSGVLNKDLRAIADKLIVHSGKGIKWKGPDPKFVEGRLKKELGYTSWSEYRDAIGSISLARKEIFQGKGSFLDKEINYIKLLLREIEDKSCLKKTHGTPIPESLLLAEITRRIAKLESMRQRAYDSHQDKTLAKGIKERLDELDRTDGLQVSLKNDFVHGRESSGVTLFLKKRRAVSKCIVVKIPGHVPSHKWKEGDAIVRPDLKDGEKQGYNGSEIEIQFEDNGMILTSRYQLAERIKSGKKDEPLARALGIESKMYVIAGIEVQKLIEGEDLNNLILGKPEMFTIEVYKELVKIALLHEALGKEFTDWSFHNFIYQSSQANKVTLRLMDLGDPTDVAYDESLSQRLGKIKQIAHSAYNKDVLIDKVDEFHSKVVNNRRTMLTLKQEVLELLRVSKVRPVREIKL